MSNVVVICTQAVFCLLCSGRLTLKPIYQTLDVQGFYCLLYDALCTLLTTLTLDFMGLFYCTTQTDPKVNLCVALGNLDLDLIFIVTMVKEREEVEGRRIERDGKVD